MTTRIVKQTGRVLREGEATRFLAIAPMAPMLGGRKPWFPSSGFRRTARMRANHFPSIRSIDRSIHPTSPFHRSLAVLPMLTTFGLVFSLGSNALSRTMVHDAHDARWFRERASKSFAKARMHLQLCFRVDSRFSECE